MTLSFSPSQAFVQDPRGKTHVLLFHPTDSIAKNLLRYSPQLHLPPLAELYILSSNHIIQADRTGIENDSTMSRTCGFSSGAPEAWEGAPLMWRTATLRPK